MEKKQKLSRIRTPSHRTSKKIQKKEGKEEVCVDITCSTQGYGHSSLSLLPELVCCLHLPTEEGQSLMFRQKIESLLKSVELEIS